MNEITRVPEITPQFGYNFSYELWVPGTRVILAKVPWDATYRDVVEFHSEKMLQEYLQRAASLSIEVKNVSLARPFQPIRLDIPFQRANTYNYMMVQGPLQAGGSPQTFYYFINSVSYIAPNTTEFTVQIDVWQTYSRQMRFGRAYVERGHVGIADKNGFKEYGRERLTAPEGLDTGNEYAIRAENHRSIGNSVSCSIMVISTTDLTADPGTINDPKLHTASGKGYVNRFPTGSNTYFFRSPPDFVAYLGKMREKPWVTRGILAVYAIPPLVDADGVFAYGPRDFIVEIPPGPDPQILNNFISFPFEIEMGDGWRDKVMDTFPEPYRKLKKFLTYPYTVIELTTFTGNPVILKPEMLNGAGLKLTEYRSLVLPNPRVVWYVEKYGMPDRRYDSDLNAANSWGREIGEGMNIQTGIYDFPLIPVVNDSYSQFLASNANSLKWQHRALDWSQNKALAGNQLSFDQSSAAIATSSEITQYGVQARNASTHLANQMAVVNAATGVANSLINGGLAGGVVGGANAVVGLAAAGYQNNQSNDINNRQAINVQNAQTRNSVYNRDTNKAMADWAAKGDYAQAIGALEARVQDAALTQPSVSGQSGGEAFMFAMPGFGWRLSVRFKTVADQALIAIGDYWLRYGYAVNRYITNMPKSLLVMSNFTYWRLKEVGVTVSYCPELFKQTIRGIFEKGVTVWRNPDDIGTLYIGDNEPVWGEYFG